jgi:predicted nucleic acid-binding protein
MLIYHLNKEAISTRFLSENYEEIAISQITFIEVLSFAFSSKEERAVREMLETFKIIDIDKRISNKAIENRKQKKIKIPDNIIAATAQIYDLILVTRNTKDFKTLDVNIINPFKED